MRVHHLNCGTLYILGSVGSVGTGSVMKRGKGVTHCLLIETAEGLVLVDTGFGRRDYTHPSFTVRGFTAFGRYPCDLEETAYQQVINLGYDPEDVKHIFITHLHLDHVGGMPDFPKAKVHLYEQEYQTAVRPRSFEERYVARVEHRAHSPNWVPHSLQGDQWFGFDCTPRVRIGDAEFVLVPLTGHTRGHSAVAVRTMDGWLMHCGDAYLFHGDVHPERPFKPRYARQVMAIMGLVKVFRVLGEYSPRLQRLVRDHGEEVQVFCSHSPQEYERLAGMG
jgi:glyoxylase-like metal-dependent hydrolase (beta-lactamase superfamily II)